MHSQFLSSKFVDSPTTGEAVKQLGALFIMQLLAQILTAATLVCPIFTGLVEGQSASTEAQHVREYLYVGGEYVDTPDGHIFQNQMYVEKLSPAEGSSRKYPVVFLHGGGQSGTVSFNTSSHNGRARSDRVTETNGLLELAE